MGVAYYIVLEREMEGMDTMMDGKAIAKHIESLDAVAGELGVQPLSAYFSISPDTALDFLAGEGLDDAEIKLPPLKNYSAEDGLTTIRALMPYAQKLGNHLVEDFAQCERILITAQKEAIGWHFEIDF